ncbi:hypothetical protein ASPZODRAFT_136636 [Penicilliopsis zonata CBS 506.65]|uniref:Uncharacterized protein n=1 Tax=Penicilliopsis zonata CBS 506.65 TaxID=1073090 RepID=A0A1L9S7F8_9EURO|nr:hypothetical protein ASPZODRAFT_136636 [Penicilliopsis zonata CBS 506.65]OJJ43092.1 hypothetical protein ASPZODRAFT_136636 [Penicilliopsis zonata CBS 506.65]
MKRVMTTRIFTLLYSPEPIIPAVAQRYLTSRYNPLRPKLQHLYDNRDPNTLWWRLATRPILDRKRVVRSWCSRRIRIAFIRALKNQGYDRDGRKIADFPQKGDPRGKPGIVGSATLLVFPEIQKESMAHVQQDVSRAVAAMIKAAKKYDQLR